MADTVAILLKFWNNKKARNLTILGILVLIMLICLSTCHSKLYSYEPVLGSTRTYICPKCEYTGKMRMVKAGELNCPECSARVGFAWKCKSCEREFCVKQNKIKKVMTKEELLRKQKRETQCTNCNSFKTYPMSKK